MGQKIIVTPKQSNAINKILRADDGTEQEHEIAKRIVKDAQVTESVAKRFINAWRLNHPELSSSNGTKLFVECDPKPTPDVKPEDQKKIGQLGKVAQIKELAAQGKTVHEIIGMGYNKNTVYRRVGEYNKAKRLGR